GVPPVMASLAVNPITSAAAERAAAAIPRNSAPVLLAHWVTGGGLLPVACSTCLRNSLRSRSACFNDAASPRVSAETMTARSSIVCFATCSALLRPLRLLLAPQIGRPHHPPAHRMGEVDQHGLDLLAGLAAAGGRGSQVGEQVGRPDRPGPAAAEGDIVGDDRPDHAGPEVVTERPERLQLGERLPLGDLGSREFGEHPVHVHPSECEGQSQGESSPVPPGESPFPSAAASSVSRLSLAASR